MGFGVSENMSGLTIHRIRCRRTNTTASRWVGGGEVVLVSFRVNALRYVLDLLGIILGPCWDTFSVVLE